LKDERIPNMKKFPLFVFCSSFLLASLAFGAKRPNILYLYVDDMGWGSIGPNGQVDRKAQGKPYVLTPNLDRLAAAGVNFRRGYGCTVCSPARSSQQTGFHQGYTFADRNDPNNAKKAIRTEDLTMGDVLAKAGYATGYWGKWGYGGSKDMQQPTLDNIQTLPTSHGYQFVVAELHHVRAHTFFQPTLWNAPAKPGTKGGLELKPNSMAKYTNNKAYPNYPALQNHPDYPKIAYCDDVYAFAALDFVRRQAVRYNKSREPFFGLFAAQIPHAPFKEVQKLPNWDQAYKDKPYFQKLAAQSQQWCAMVTRIDAHFGNLLDALDDPNGDGDKSDSVAQDTLVVFQSDNGGPRGSNREELDANGGLLGSKGSIFEGGIRVPTIMRWPAKITARSQLKTGTNTDLVIDCSDLLPTFCELAGAPVPLGLSGVSIAPTLTGEGDQRLRDFLIHEAGGQASIIRGDYKLIRSRGNAKAPKPGTKNKKRTKKSGVGKDVGKVQLYDLKTDPAEKNNIASKRPQTVRELNALLTGERVDEAAGFANTYHSWQGAKDGSIHDASNWSDYVYQNAGITYTQESGPPKAHWCAKIDQGSTVASKDAEFLGLALNGSLTVKPRVKVSARNELRVGNKGRLILQGGSVSSLRWLDIQAGGALIGHGTVNAALHLKGTLSLSLGKPLVVDGPAQLSGKLSLAEVGKAKSDESLTVLKAESISGHFDNDKISHAGQSYSIAYTATSVTLTAK
jgi:arylsulfatase A-like enzyme